MGNRLRSCDVISDQTRSGEVSLGVRGMLENWWELPCRMATGFGSGADEASSEYSRASGFNRPNVENCSRLMDAAEGP